MTTRSPNTTGSGGRLPVDTIVRATDAVGIVTRYRDLTDPYLGVPARPLTGGAPWQAVPHCLRLAPPDEIARARTDESGAVTDVDAPAIRLEDLTPHQRDGRSCCWCSFWADKRFRVPHLTAVGARLRACETCAQSFDIAPAEEPTLQPAEPHPTTQQGH
ncbi:hypothetical protein QCN29_26315 [Streptomyces sp. HNM0663]|uniref:Uncharacterized protein n=1 Tax=Streptomyces chengmaiensis TaxID=3040919 RepID=A0ABT6HU52_9ACTN|nr:hypothetical protein [Streptomyces chengmaiensis]MDH2392235.1 hypothetical protein [Streptomyces chengmaiensis]